MANLREEVPAEFTDDERWYKYFTKKSLIIMIILLFYLYAVISFFGMFRLAAVGVIIWALTALPVFLCFCMKIPADDPIHGGGAELDEILLRILAVRLHGRIYCDMAAGEDRDQQ